MGQFYVQLEKAIKEGRGDIWTETDLIGVTPMIYNDTVCVSKTNDIAIVQRGFGLRLFTVDCRYFRSDAIHVSISRPFNELET